MIPLELVIDVCVSPDDVPDFVEVHGGLERADRGGQLVGREQRVHLGRQKVLQKRQVATVTVKVAEDELQIIREN